jgi:Heterokaryon incompatibility protein (HET)
MPTGALGKVSDGLPRVIQNTISLLRVLGERYVWTDSLCIVQNSSRSRKLSAVVVDLVYGNAHLTTYAVDGEGGSTGLRGIMPSPWMMPEKRNTPQYIAECTPNVRLMVSYLAEAYIERFK